MMKLNFFGALALCNLSISITNANPIDPLVGTWQIIDHRTSYYISDIVIRKDSRTQQYSAVINKAYPRPGAQTADVCSACEGVLRNQPLFGMQTLTGLVQSTQPRQYHKGVWLNPHDGKRYRIETTLNTKQDQMKVHATSENTNSTLIWKKL